MPVTVPSSDSVAKSQSIKVRTLDTASLRESSPQKRCVVSVLGVVGLKANALVDDVVKLITCRRVVMMMMMMVHRWLQGQALDDYDVFHHRLLAGGAGRVTAVRGLTKPVPNCDHVSHCVCVCVSCVLSRALAQCEQFSLSASDIRAAGRTGGHVVLEQNNAV